MDAAAPLGRILTFYSYKGGTGRSMALANIAWVLACAGRRVLAIDWDLEAPGLHRYFRPFLIDEEVTASDGLMDLIDRYANEAIRPVENHETPDPDWFLSYADVSGYIVSINFPHFRAGGKIDLLPAGRQGDGYALTVNSFNWQNFYDRLGGGGFFEAVKQGLRAEYDYILIDSRTGVSDTAGICSVQMPDTLVVCFTYNNQSIQGASAVARSARVRHDKLVEEKLALHRAGRTIASASFFEETTRPYRVFPVPMRVDDGESDRLAIRQAFAREAFADLVDHIGADVLGEYWKTVEVPQTVYYSYEEVLAPFKDDAQDPKTVLASLLRLTRFVTDRDVIDFRMPIAPAERQMFLEAFAQTPATTKTADLVSESQRETDLQAAVRNADAAFAAMTDAEQTLALRVLGRLVRVGRDEEGGGYTPIRASLDDFTDAERALVSKLASYNIVTITTVPRPFAQSSRAAEPKVSLTDSRLLASWPTLIKWLDEHHAFLTWRQQLRSYLSDWERSGRDRGALLSGRLLSEADLATVRRADDLNEAETRYIQASRQVAAAPSPDRPFVPAEPDDQINRESTGGFAASDGTRSRRGSYAWGAAGATVLVGILWMAIGFRSSSTLAPPEPGKTDVPHAVPTSVPTPQFVGLSTDEARKTAAAVGLKVEMTDGTSLPAAFLEGVVVAQTPPGKALIAPGAVVRLTVSTLAAQTPTLARLTLSDALKALTDARLQLGTTASRYVPNAPVGTVIDQQPLAGSRVAAGTAVSVVVARAPKLSDFQIRIFFVETDIESKKLAERVAGIVRRAGAESVPSPRPADYFTGPRSPKRHEIRYNSPLEKQVADDLQRLLRQAGFPPFTPTRVDQRSEGFISILLATESGAPPSAEVRLTIEGAPFEDVEIWYRGERETGQAPLVYSGKIERNGRLTMAVPRAYLVVGKPGRRSGTPLDLHRERSSTYTFQMPKAAK